MSLNWKQAHDTKYVEWKQAQTNTIAHTTAEQKAISHYIYTHIRCVHYFKAYGIKNNMISSRCNSHHSIFFMFFLLPLNEMTWIHVYKKRKKNQTRQSNWKPTLYSLSNCKRENTTTKETAQRGKTKKQKRVSKTHF